MTAVEKIALARKHLDRVQSAWDDPTDWDDLSLYGFYCLEAAIEAAAIHTGLRTSKKHWQKEQIAEDLHQTKGLPDVSGLLSDLNEARKSAAYGDIERPKNLNPEDVGRQIEEYVVAVENLIGV